MPVPKSPLMIAKMTSTKVVNRYSAAIKAIAEDWGANDIEEQGADGLINTLHKYSDNALFAIANEAVNMAFHSGRAEGLQEEQQEILTRTGKQPVWRRSSVMEKNSCDLCVAADGEEIDGPDDDLSEIHEGPPETCLCIPYADLEEEPGEDAA